MTAQNEIPPVTMTNTKKEMLEAYHLMKKQLQEKAREMLNAEKERAEMKKELAAATADTQAAQDPLHRLHDLRGAISRELASLAERFEQEMDTYRKVQGAVEAKQEELKSLYEIETAASDLAALLNAQRAKKEEFGREMEARRAALEEEMREARSQWGKEKTAREQDVKEQADVIKKQRQREKDEFEYAFEREKEKSRNALEDELNALTKEIEQKRKDLEQELSRKKAELELREESIAKREKELASLQEQVQTFPQTLESRVQAAVDDTKTRLSSDFEKMQALTESRYEGEKNVLVSKVESLERMVKAQETQIAELSRRHEQAYEKVQEIANRAVEASRREIISVPYRPSSSSGSEDKHNS